MIDSEATRAWLREQFNDLGIHRVRPGEPPMPGNMEQRRWLWQFAPRRVLFDPRAMRAVVTLFDDLVADIFAAEPFQVCGIATGGIGLAQSIALLSRHRITAFMLRKGQRPNGRRNWIEGRPDARPVMMVDDLCSSQRTFGRSAEILQDEGLELYDHAFVPIARTGTLGKGGERVPENVRPLTLRLGYRIKVLSLFTYADFDLHWEEWQARSGDRPAGSLPAPMREEA